MWWARGGPGSDIGEIVADLRSQGWTEDAIAIEVEEAARLAEPGFIRPENWAAAQVFERCQWTVHVGLHKPFYAGIAAAELEAVCGLMNILPDDRPRTLDSVRVMAHAAAPVLNEDRG